MKAAAITQAFTQLISGIGSVALRRDANGKIQVGVVPILALVLFGSTVACSVQNDEPFRQCLKATLSDLKEIVNDVPSYQ